jgi:hypothetical protein
MRTTGVGHRELVGPRLLCVTLLLVSILSFGPLRAQVTGTIGGVVRDQTGAVVPGVDVTAQLVGQPLVRRTQTNDMGFYDLLALPRGVYEVRAELPGFQTQVQSGVELTAGANVRVDFALTVGEVSTLITVTAPPVLVDARSETQSSLIDDLRITDLPLSGRNVVALAGLHAGITNITAAQDMTHTREGPAMAVHGSNRNQNLFTLNNAAFMQFNQTTGLNPPPPDAVEEVRIQTHNFAAEFGQTGGSQVSIVTRAGTNRFRGALWNFHRNSALNARSFFQAARPGRRENQAGGSAGGPILKDKLFAFGSFQRLWDRRTAGSAVVFVPTDAERAGDFRGTARTLNNPIDALTGQPFRNNRGEPCVAGNVISPDCISPVAQNLLNNYIPRSPDGVINNVVTLLPAPRDNESLLARVDYHVSEKNQINAHFYGDRNRQSSWPGNINFLQLNRFSDSYQFTVNNTYTLRANLINEATFAYITAKSEGEPTTHVRPQELGVNVLVGPPGRQDGIDFSVTGGPSITYPAVFNDDYYSWEIKNNTTWIRGNHTFKWGYNLIRPVYDFDLNLTRNATFTGARTGVAMADFMLGAFDSSRLQYGYAVHDPESYKHNFFIQDTFRVHPKVVLNYGLRWEPWIAYDQQSGFHTGWIPGVQSTVVPDAPTGLLFPGDPELPGKLTYDNIFANFGPRAGFAWDFYGDARMVVRAGYGLMFQQVQGETTHAAEAPWRTTSDLRNGRIEDPFGSLGLEHPPLEPKVSFGCYAIEGWPGLRCDQFPLPLVFAYTDPNVTTPYMHHLNLSIQRQVGEHWMIENSYIGKISRDLVGHNFFNAAPPINSPRTGLPPSAANIAERTPYSPGIIGAASRVLDNYFESWYHSYQLKVDRRFSQGFSIQGSYVFSKNLTTMPQDTLGQISSIPNPFDLASLKGPSLLDRRHVGVVSWVWTPRTGFATNPALSAVLGGWTVTGLWRAQSGNPLTFTMGRDVAVTGQSGAGAQYATLASGASLEDIKLDHSSRHDMIMRYFNTGAFIHPSSVPLGTFGNVGRGAVYGPPDVSMDMSLLRNINVTEQVRLQLRGEFFNAFNQVNFSNPTTNAGSGNFGRITGASAGRQIQVAAKIMW